MFVVHSTSVINIVIYEYFLGGGAWSKVFQTDNSSRLRTAEVPHGHSDAKRNAIQRRKI